jgi:hypothetical protein
VRKTTTFFWYIYEVLAVAKVDGTYVAIIHIMRGKGTGQI